MNSDIHLERVEVVEDLPTHIRVKYTGKDYSVLKSRTSEWSKSPMANLACSLEFRVISPETTVFLDDSVPKSFQEVMIFHEIREAEYASAGFPDAHKRAVNDEFLYVTKFFTAKDRNDYLAFAKKYRADKETKVKMCDLALFYAYVSENDLSLAFVLPISSQVQRQKLCDIEARIKEMGGIGWYSLATGNFNLASIVESARKARVQMKGNCYPVDYWIVVKLGDDRLSEAFKGLEDCSVVDLYPAKDELLVVKEVFKRACDAKRGARRSAEVARSSRSESELMEGTGHKQ